MDAHLDRSKKFCLYDPQGNNVSLNEVLALVNTAVETRSISSLHDLEATPLLNPYMIGMTYLKRFNEHAHLWTNEGRDSNSMFQLTEDITEIEANLKNQLIHENKLSGVTYIAFSSSRLPKCLTKQTKAVLIATGGGACSEALLVSNRLVGFAVVQFFNYWVDAEKPDNKMAKQGASELNLYTLTHNCYDLVFIARSFDDLLTIASAVGINIGLGFFNTSSYWRLKPVYVELGRQIEYNFDKVLYKLALILEKQGHPISFCFGGTPQLRETVNLFMQNENSWKSHGELSLELMKYHSYAKSYWTYILAAEDTIRQAFYLLHGTEHDKAYALSIPVKETKKSVEVHSRKTFKDCNLFDFAHKIEHLLPGVRKEVFPQVDNDLL